MVKNKSKCHLLLLVITLLTATNFIHAQNIVQRYFKSMFSESNDSGTSKFIIYPTLAYAPETSWELGLSSLYIYHAKGDTTNRLSEISGFTFATFEKQFGLLLEHAIYTDKNKWFILGKLRLQSFPYKYHGIGMNTPKNYIAIADAKQFNIKERVLRQIDKNFFIGLELDFQHTSKVNFISSKDSIPYELPIGYRGFNNLGVGLGILYDTRKNVLNVRKGLFSEIAFLTYLPQISNHNFTTTILDNRIYRPLSKDIIFAAQVLGQFNTSGAPFNQLALMGGENMMRGYYTGRYRDNNQVAAQVELRFLPLPLGFTKRIGAGLFASTAQVFSTMNQFNTNKFVFAGGGSLKFLIFPKKDIYTRLDLAFTEEGTGFYIFIGEAF